MTRFIQLILLSFALYFSALSAHAAETEPVDAGEAIGQIVTSHDSVAPGQTLAMGVFLDINPGWHVYWVNPGDSGEPFDIRPDENPNLTYGEIEWPLPKPVPTMSIVNYGFEDRPLFPLSLTVSEDVSVGDKLTLSGIVYYLICADICIPESFEYSLDLPVEAEPSLDSRWNANIERERRKMPTTEDWASDAALVNDQLVVNVLLPEGISADNAYLFPTVPGFINHSAEQVVTQSGDVLTFTLVPEFELSGGIKDVPYLLKWSEDGTETGVYLTARANGAVAGAPVAPPMPTGTDGASAVGIELFTAIVFAILGGLILNLMPCVFPVIALKGLHIAGMGADDRAKIRRESWAYVAGVLVTFMVLTLILIALRAAGEVIGWGMHLQSPLIIGFLALLFVAIALNLFGLFEFGSGAQGVGQSLTEKGGLKGAFFTGALAVIVATPCTAPLMAGAMGWAFAQSSLVMILVMLALGLGFALPFLILVYLPARLLKLPKPGPWMETFKQFMGFFMLAAAIYLVFVATSQTGIEGMILILVAALLLAFGIWALRKSGMLSKLIGGLALLAALATPFFLSGLSGQAAEGFAASQTGGELNKEAWSTARVAEIRSEGRGVFVDFTAAWCVTCKVNERGALKDADVVTAFAETDTAFLVADWTRKDDVIAAELAKYDRAGVPLYLYFRPLRQGETHADVKPVILPQILTANMIVDTLNGG